MSESPRKLIRKAVQALLVTATGEPPEYPTVATNRVYGNLAKELPNEKLPALAVYTLAEGPAPEATNVNSVRSLTLLVEPHHDFKDEGGDELDDFAWAVERILMDSPNLGLPSESPVDIQEINWLRTTLNIKEPQGLILGLGIIEIEIKYLWLRPVEELDLAPFERIHVDQLGSTPEGDDLIEVRVELPQE